MVKSYTRILMRLFLLIVFIGLNTFSQKIDLGDTRGYQNSSLDTLNNTFDLYFTDHILSIDLDNFQKTYTDLYYGNKVGQDEGRLGSVTLRVQDTLYFIHGSGGMVYMIKNDTVRRVDKSFDHQMQHGACWFEHNNTAFSYGGYGFWSNRDFFTYYTPNRMNGKYIIRSIQQRFQEALRIRNSSKRLMSFNSLEVTI